MIPMVSIFLMYRCCSLFRSTDVISKLFSGDMHADVVQVALLQITFRGGEWSF